MDMKITNIPNLQQVYNQDNTKKIIKANPSSSPKSDEVILSNESIVKQKEIETIKQANLNTSYQIDNLKQVNIDNMQKIEELQRQISSGNYKIDAQKIAAKMIEQLKNHNGVE